MYTLKTIVRRGTLFGAVATLSLATLLPSVAVFADALNPLTERSLLLSSSAPGFQDTDGAGNSESNPNAWNGGEYYAPPGSGPNGKKSGETFTFRVSTDSVETGKIVKALTLQYCTGAAGNCQAPGNNSGDEKNTDRMDNATAHALSTPTSDFDVVTDGTTPWAESATPVTTGNAGAPGTYQVTVDGAASTGWTMSTSNVEDTAHSGALTGKNNFITLVNAAGVSPVFNDQIEVRFTPNTDNYITNPGDDSFFVRINTYDSETTTNHIPNVAADDHIIDGGVTVANVMTDSIHITTKVLETMAFSVGTQNPDTQDVQHGSCDAIDVVDGNRLNLGDPDAEYSLETGRAWDVNSYWRLSSNSSGGATVYYSGDTLRNTVGDHIADMPAKAFSQPGTEKFGLALVDAGGDTLDAVNVFPANHVTPSISPLGVETPYSGDGAAGLPGSVLPISEAVSADNAQFAFLETSQMVPEVIAQNGDQVISCATSKVRYIGNIAADTPAGIYSTKINFLAAPQY